jgi:predicted dehydrogenase
VTVVRDVPAPSCPSGALLVRNAFSVISSGTERATAHRLQRSLAHKARERPDLVRDVIDRARREGIRTTQSAIKRKLSEERPVGYSSAGRILEVGASVRDFNPGEAVACAGTGHANHAEIVAVPANLCARVPQGVPMEAAAMSAIAAIALHAIRLADARVGERVGVIGCGLVGQIACRLLRAAGVSVIAFDVDPAQVEYARASGAEHAFVVSEGTAEHALAATDGIGVDQVLITAAAPSNQPLLLAAEIARTRGALVLVGDVPVEIPRAPLYEKELSFRVARSYGPGRYDLEYEERGLDYPIGYVRWTEQRNMECVLELQSRGALELTDLIETVPVDEAPEAYERLMREGKERTPAAIALAYPEPHAEAALRSKPIVRATETPQRRVPAVAVPMRQADVRVGLIGPGHFAAQVLVPALVEAGAHLELVGGGSGPSAEAATRTLGFARVAESEAAVVRDEAVDAVVIATRHASHAALTKEALASGKHVFCEKPLALTRTELDDVLDAAADSQGILSVGFNRRFAPILRELRDFVAPTGPLLASYRVSAGRMPPDHWTHDLTQGGGRLLGELCHFVDSLAFLGNSDVVQVHATGYGAPELPAQARDNVIVSLTFRDGSVGAIIYVADGSSRLPKERLEVFSGARTGILADFRTLELFEATGTQRRRLRAQDKGHRQEIDAFVRGVRAGEAPIPLDEIANVSIATLAVVESLLTGRTVQLQDQSRKSDATV